MYPFYKICTHDSRGYHEVLFQGYNTKYARSRATNYYNRIVTNPYYPPLHSAELLYVRDEDQEDYDVVKTYREETDT